MEGREDVGYLGPSSLSTGRDAPAPSCYHLPSPNTDKAAIKAFPMYAQLNAVVSMSLSEMHPVPE